MRSCSLRLRHCRQWAPGMFLPAEKQYRGVFAACFHATADSHIVLAMLAATTDPVRNVLQHLVSYPLLCVSPRCGSLGQLGLYLCPFYTHCQSDGSFGITLSSQNAGFCCRC